MKYFFLFTSFILLCFILFISINGECFSQQILFDFDTAPLHTSLPMVLTQGGVTARFSATGQGYSIQNANVLGFTPPGFGGRIIYPNSVFLSDLRVGFSQVLTEFSIMYACQELGCDDAATMRVTAYKNGVYVGYANRTATFPGTWPVDTLSFNFSAGFDSVVVHYQSHPPTCQDYGVIYMADNMRITPQTTAIAGNENDEPKEFLLMQNFPNPFNPVTNIGYEISKKTFVSLKIFDINGKEIKTLINVIQEKGRKNVIFDGSYLSSGIYYYQLKTDDFIQTKKSVLLK